MVRNFNLISRQFILHVTLYVVHQEIKEGVYGFIGSEGLALRPICDGSRR